MTIKKIENAIQAPETVARYMDEVYIDATKTDGTTVQVLDTRRTRETTKAQLEAELVNGQAIVDKVQGKLDEITALEAE